MFICKVQGKCVSTIKKEKLTGSSLVSVRRITGSGNLSSDMMVAVDTIGCCIGETVLVVSGKGARMAAGDENSPVDLAIVGIVDDYDFGK